MNSKKEKEKRSTGGEKNQKTKNKDTNTFTNSDTVQRTHTNKYYDPYIHYQYTNTSLQTTFQILNTLQKRQHTLRTHKTTRPHTLKTQNTTKHNTTIKTLQMIPIPSFILNTQIHHLKTTFHILNALATYKYIHFKTKFMCPRSIAGVPSSQAPPGYHITAPPYVCVPAVLGALPVWIQNQKKKHLGGFGGTFHAFGTGCNNLHWDRLHHGYRTCPWDRGRVAAWVYNLSLGQGIGTSDRSLLTVAFPVPVGKVCT